MLSRASAGARVQIPLDNFVAAPAPWPGRVIAVGIVPGLSSLAYCIANVRLPNAEPVEAAILVGGTLRRSQASLAKKANVHRLILDVILERHPAALVVIGPPGPKADPPEHVAAASLMIRALGAYFRIPVEEVTMQQVCQELDVREGLLGRAVRGRLRPSQVGRDRRLTLAAAYVLTGVSRFVSRETGAAKIP